MNDETDNVEAHEPELHVVTVSAEFGAFELFWSNGDVWIYATDIPTEVVPWGVFEPRKIALEFISDSCKAGYSWGLWPGGDSLEIDSEHLRADDPDLLGILRSDAFPTDNYNEGIFVNGVAVTL